MTTIQKLFVFSLLLALACGAMVPCGYGADKPAPAPAASPSPVAASTPTSGDADIKKMTEILAAQGVTGVTISTGNGVSDIDFKKIMEDLVTHGVDSTLRSDVTTGLGLTHKGGALKVRQDVFTDDTGAMHFIAKLDHDGGYIICLATKQQAYDFRLDKDRVLVAAVSSSPKEGVAVLQNKEAQKKLDAEWQLWAAIAGALSK